jgi:hypothetical protein
LLFFFTLLLGGLALAVGPGEEEEILYQENALARNALAVKQCLVDNYIPVFQTRMYSSDLAPCNFYLFIEAKSAFKGTNFQSLDDVKSKTVDLLKG